MSHPDQSPREPSKSSGSAPSQRPLPRVPDVPHWQSVLPPGTELGDYTLSGMLLRDAVCRVYEGTSSDGGSVFVAIPTASSQERFQSGEPNVRFRTRGYLVGQGMRPTELELFGVDSARLLSLTAERHQQYSSPILPTFRGRIDRGQTAPPAYVFDCSDGGSLRSALQRREVIPLSLFAGLASELHRLSQRGFPGCGNITPENLFFSRMGAMDLLVVGGASWQLGGEDSRLFVSTPQYNPCLLSGQPGDLFSLGSILYETCVGHPPHFASTPWEYGGEVGARLRHSEAYAYEVSVPSIPDVRMDCQTDRVKYALYLEIDRVVRRCWFDASFTMQRVSQALHAIIAEHEQTP